jgi:hypothetical protein
MSELKVNKDLEYLLKDKLKIDVKKRHEEFVAPRDEWKAVVLKEEGLSRDAKRRVFATGMMLAQILNEAGYYKWLPDIIKDTAIKLLLDRLIQNKSYIKAMGELK